MTHSKLSSEWPNRLIGREQAAEAEPRPFCRQPTTNYFLPATIPYWLQRFRLSVFKNCTNRAAVSYFGEAQDPHTPLFSYLSASCGTDQKLIPTQ